MSTLPCPSGTFLFFPLTLETLCRNQTLHTSLLVFCFYANLPDLLWCTPWKTCMHLLQYYHLLISYMVLKQSLFLHCFGVFEPCFLVISKTYIWSVLVCYSSRHVLRHSVCVWCVLSKSVVASTVKDLSCWTQGASYFTEKSILSVQLCALEVLFSYITLAQVTYWTITGRQISCDVIKSFSQAEELHSVRRWLPLETNAAHPSFSIVLAQTFKWCFKVSKTHFDKVYYSTLYWTF